jgi:hypothetical protein
MSLLFRSDSVENWPEFHRKYASKQFRLRHMSMKEIQEERRREMRQERLWNFVLRLLGSNKSNVSESSSENGDNYGERHGWREGNP